MYSDYYSQLSVECSAWSLSVTFVIFVGFLCGLVVRVPGYRSRGPELIPGATKFSEE
jgi:hypothetical protein